MKRRGPETGVVVVLEQIKRALSLSPQMEPDVATGWEQRAKRAQRAQRVRVCVCALVCGRADKNNKIRWS